MNEQMRRIIDEARRLPIVSLTGVQGYRSASEAMIRSVDQEMSGRPDITSLIGNNPLPVMFANHRHHAAFMISVFSTAHYDLLACTVPWVYRSYHAHGFSYDYFPAELQTWKRVLSACLSPQETKDILSVYDWLLDRHDRMIGLSLLPLPSTITNDAWLRLQHDFLLGLLSGDHRGCLQMARDFMQNESSLAALYLQIIQPVLYEIGRMWELAEISAAQEHLASAIVARIMAGLPARTTHSVVCRGKAVVAAVQGEQHEIGTWMVSDLLEEDGWQVRYLGADTPLPDLLSFLKEYRPDLLALSVTMPFNLAEVKQTIESIRGDSQHAGLKIMLGGRVFNDNPELLSLMGADGFAGNAAEAVRQARTWVY